MSKGALVVLTNPVSTEREAEYNNWYNNVHAGEVCAVPGVTGMTRYKMASHQIPDSQQPPHRYLAIYTLDDVEKTVPALNAAAPKLTPSDTVDLGGVHLAIFEPIFSYKK